MPSTGATFFQSWISMDGQYSIHGSRIHSLHHCAYASPTKATNTTKIDELRILFIQPTYHWSSLSFVLQTRALQ